MTLENLHRIKSFLLFLGLMAHLTACITSKQAPWPPSLLRSHILSLRDSCQLTDKSGFTADLGLSDRDSARIEAAWDSSGNLNGQVINPLGEDLMNFRIDSSGVLQSDVSVKQGAALGPALEFLAELGTTKTRQLLCSGLFLSANEQFAQSFGQELPKIDFTLSTHGTDWRLTSELIQTEPDQPSNDRLTIKTDVTTSDLFFRRTIASIEWKGQKKGRYMRPILLTLRSSQSSLKLSFLDFE